MRKAEENVAAARDDSLKLVCLHLKRAIELAEKTGDLPDALTFRDLLTSAKQFVELHELLEGRATHRTEIEIGDVQQVIGSVFRLAWRYVPREMRPAFLAEIADVTGPTLAPVDLELEAHEEGDGE